METIFVAIASYRDLECPKTLTSLYTQAYFPLRIYVGICQQNEVGDIECCLEMKNSNIRIMRIPASMARGPTWARYHCSKLYAGEKYYLQIDSHTTFTPGWDVEFIRMLNKLPLKSILSYYPNSTGSESVGKVGRICNAIIDCTREILTLPGATLLEPSSEPTPTAFVTGCCFFAPGRFLTEVPYDPLLPDLFTGEEMLFSARLWTNGWNIFSPNVNILSHTYERLDSPKFWDRWSDQQDDSAALSKVRYLLGMGKIEPVPVYLQVDLMRYGMGQERTIDEFWKYIGMSPNSPDEGRDFCKTSLDASSVEVFKAGRRNRVWTWIILGILFLYIIGKYTLM